MTKFETVKDDPHGEPIVLCDRCGHREVAEEGDVCAYCEPWIEEGL